MTRSFGYADGVTCLDASMFAQAFAAAPMEMSGSAAHFAATREAYSVDHTFLVKLLSVPKPIGFEKYFTVKFAVYDGHHPGKPLPSASIRIFAGMRHGLKHGFAHGMESSPKISGHEGVFTVQGMYFTMMGPWVVKMWVSDGTKHGIVYFKLPCCGA